MDNISLVYVGLTPFGAAGKKIRIDHHPLNYVIFSTLSNCDVLASMCALSFKNHAIDNHPRTRFFFFEEKKSDL